MKEELDVHSLKFQWLKKKATETTWMRIYLHWLYTDKQQTPCNLTAEQMQRCKVYLLADLYDDDPE